MFDPDVIFTAFLWFWLSSVVAAGIWAYERGRGGWGVVFGLLFGPLGLIMTGLLGRSPPKEAERQLAIEAAKIALTRRPSADGAELPGIRPQPAAPRDPAAEEEERLSREAAERRRAAEGVAVEQRTKEAADVAAFRAWRAAEPDPDADRCNTD